MKGSIRLQGVSKVYRRMARRGRLHSLKGALLHGDLVRGLAPAEAFTAVDAVDLEVAPGEAVALVGPNGSGKSTLLKLISGILKPTSGRIDVEGRVTALIELGAGFHPEITGRENVLINGMLLGLSRAEVEAKLDEIVRFADIGGFIDQPVKTYSSGMYVRLGFAVSVAADPDILLIDEVLAVGDAAFTRRSLDRIARMRREGVTLVIVSHDLDLVADLADRAYYLRAGRVVAEGSPDAVVARYRSDVAGAEQGGEREAPEVRVVEPGKRWGTGDVEIVSVEVSSGGVPMRVVPSGADCTVHIRYRVNRPVDDFVFGLAWHRTDGVHVGGHNTLLDGLEPRRLAASGEVRCTYPSLDLAPGEYSLDAAVHARGGLAYDYWCQAGRLRVTGPVDWPGVWAPAHHWEADADLWRR
jgi:ABC-type polysaccharide/polyol phosphate transport system, ATPase component